MRGRRRESARNMRRRYERHGWRAAQKPRLWTNSVGVDEMPGPDGGLCQAEAAAFAGALSEEVDELEELEELAEPDGLAELDSDELVDASLEPDDEE
jgi:hypothetical protein